MPSEQGADPERDQGYPSGMRLVCRKMVAQPLAAGLKIPALSLPALSSAYHHVDLAAPAQGADESLAPIKDGGSGAVLLRHLCRVRLGLMLARLAPHDKPDLGSGSGTERHRFAGFRFHPRRRLLAAVARGG
jgi:hypothetical protein